MKFCMDEAGVAADRKVKDDEVSVCREANQEAEEAAIAAAKQAEEEAIAAAAAKEAEEAAIAAAKEAEEAAIAAAKQAEEEAIAVAAAKKAGKETIAAAAAKKAEEEAIAAAKQAVEEAAENEAARKKTTVEEGEMYDYESVDLRQTRVSGREMEVAIALATKMNAVGAARAAIEKTKHDVRVSHQPPPYLGAKVGRGLCESVVISAVSDDSLS